jgi:hypothetical protein
VFGSHGRLERKLRMQGKVAWATVLSAQVTVPALYMNTRSQGGHLHQQRASNSRWKMMVRVEPGGEPPFDAEISAWLEDRPEVVPVLYDPSDHRKVLLDKPAFTLYRAEQSRLRDAEAMRSAGPRPGPVQTLADVLAPGQRVPGALKAFAPTGTTPRSQGITPSGPELLDAPRCTLDIELHVPNLAPMEVRTTQPVPPAQVPNLAIGLQLPCGVDPANPQQRFVIDWDAIGH